MESPKLAELKKELNSHDPHELKELCLRLAKYKTENKELLHYLIFYANQKEDYVSEIKDLLTTEFDGLYTSVYYLTKQLRKITRLMNKHIKYIGEKDKELEIALFFCQLFIKKVNINTTHKALIGLLYRQLKRIQKLIPKMEEDLQFDFQQEFDEILKTLKLKRPSFHIHEIS